MNIEAEITSFHKYKDMIIEEFTLHEVHCKI